MRISGRVVIAQGFVEIPVKEEELLLRTGNRLIAKTQTDLKGAFFFTGVFPVGEYSLMLSSQPRRLLQVTLREDDLIDLKLILIVQVVE